MTMDLKPWFTGDETQLPNRVHHALARDLARIEAEGLKNSKLLLIFRVSAGFKFDESTRHPLNANGTPINDVQLRVVPSDASGIFTASASVDGTRELCKNPYIDSIQGMVRFEKAPS